ncbi:MAG: response regulator [Candidatus Omnitrophica bacterium]|jgi:CheY-like chemotaxis protein|nr:response regulator [Candidatus Omnitrophota bacterium]MDD5654207.1 response regulator [Candidatus Omnitrophota bacterium]
MEKKKVMIIDDEEYFLALVKINLESTGKYEVRTLQEARDILSQVESYKPDVILLDMLMPKMDGVQVCGMLNDSPAGKHIPIITLSASDTTEDRLKMDKMGVVDFLAKPIEKDELIAKIEKALQNR